MFCLPETAGPVVKQVRAYVLFITAGVVGVCGSGAGQPCKSESDAKLCKRLRSRLSPTRLDARAFHAGEPCSPSRSGRRITLAKGLVP